MSTRLTWFCLWAKDVPRSIFTNVNIRPPSPFTRLLYFFLSVRKKSRQLIFFFSLILRIYFASATPNFKPFNCQLKKRWNRKWPNFYNHANFHYRKSETQWLTEFESTLYGLQRLFSHAYELKMFTQKTLYYSLTKNEVTCLFFFLL